MSISRAVVCVRSFQGGRHTDPRPLQNLQSCSATGNLSDAKFKASETNLADFREGAGQHEAASCLPDVSSASGSSVSASAAPFGLMSASISSGHNAANAYRRLVPLADIMQRSKSHNDHPFVGGFERRRRKSALLAHRKKKRWGTNAPPSKNSWKPECK